MVEGNACWRRSLEFMERYNARDWDWIGDFYVEDVVFEDRRSGLQATVIGRDEQLEHMKVIADIGTVQSSLTKIAELGDHLALVKVDWEAPVEGSEPYEIGTLMVAELDESGRCVGLAIFDVDDLEAAKGELEARFNAQNDESSRRPRSNS